MSIVFVFKQKTAYEMRISDWSSDVCSSDLQNLAAQDDEDRDHRQAGNAVERDQNQDDRGDEQLVGDGIEEAAERRLLPPGAREIAVEIVGDGRGGRSEERRVGKE